MNLRQRLSDFLSQAKHHAAYEIPLFPLNTVLFPGGKLPVRVFEPRHMEMISTCLKNGQPFGISLLRADNGTHGAAQPEAVGCLVEIVDWDMQQPGVLNITVLGIRRFHVESHGTNNNGQIVAQVVNISEEPEAPIPPQHHACATLLRHIVEHLGEHRFALPLRYDDLAWVGYRLAELLPLKLSVRQNMLEMNDSLVRIEILHTFLTQQGLLK